MGRKKSTPAKDAPAATPAAPLVEEAPVETTATAEPVEEEIADASAEASSPSASAEEVLEIEATADAVSDKRIEMPVPDKRDLGTRVFAHPQLDVIQDGHSVWIPGQEIHPADVDSDTWKRLLQDGLVVSEATYKLSFPELWNQAHPREQVGVPRTERGEIDAAEERPVGEIK
jgi:hypothetical protein